MKKTIHQTIQQMSFNGKSLILFELFYRVLGLFVIYPIARLIFYYSISVSKYSYITHTLFTDYLTKPSTLFLLFLLVALLSVYIVIEFIFLALLFDLGYHKQKISFQSFILLGSKRVSSAVKKYHIFILIPAFVLLFLVQLMNIAGIATTIKIPAYIIYQINQNPLYNATMYMMLAVLLFVFIESVFSIHLFSIDQHSLKSAYRQSRHMLKGKRLKIILEFGFVNLLLNMMFYALYFIIIALIAAFIWIVSGQDRILGYLLSVLYSVYIGIGLFATIILIPVNFSLITTWYYQYKEKNGLVKKDSLLIRMSDKTINLKWIKRGLIIFFIVFSILNIATIFSVISPKSQFELLNQTEIVAHRGSSLYAPENTLASIELAIEQGADAVEFDVRLTLDEIPVLLHDETIKRTTNITTNVLVKDITLEELKNLSAGSWFSDEYESESIPTLEEVITLIDHRIHIFLELKVNSAVLEQKVIEILETYHMLDETTFLSTSSDQLQRIKLINSELPTLLLLSSYFGSHDTLVNLPGVDSFGFERSFILSYPTLLDLIHKKGKTVYVWTVNDPTQMEQIILKDIDGVITNDPIIAREIIYTENTQDIYVDLLRKLFKRE